MKPPRKWHPPLDPDDVALWEAVKKSVKRLEETQDYELPVKSRKAKPEAKEKQAETATARKIAPKKMVSQPAAIFDRTSLRKIKNGRSKIEDMLDLHGLRQPAAHKALEAFVKNARERGFGLVLVIAGKGDRFGAKEGGILRQQVPRWLASGELARLVLSFRTAAIQHGGEGAFYLRLRKRR